MFCYHEHRSSSQGNYIERFYINTDSIAENSLLITVNNVSYTEVKSFFDKENLYDNQQFLIKFSNKPDTPIVVYVKGTKLNDVINVTYRITSGEFGNID